MGRCPCAAGVRLPEGKARAAKRSQEAAQTRRAERVPRERGTGVGRRYDLSIAQIIVNEKNFDIEAGRLSVKDCSHFANAIGAIAISAFSCYRARRFLA